MGCISLLMEYSVLNSGLIQSNNVWYGPCTPVSIHFSQQVSSQNIHTVHWLHQSYCIFFPNGQYSVWLGQNRLLCYLHGTTMAGTMLLELPVPSDRAKCSLLNLSLQSYLFSNIVITFSDCSIQMYSELLTNFFVNSTRRCVCIPQLNWCFGNFGFMKQQSFF